jgi:hypothetical protein
MLYIQVGAGEKHPARQPAMATIVVPAEAGTQPANYHWIPDLRFALPGITKK